MRPATATPGSTGTARPSRLARCADAPTTRLLFVRNLPAPHELERVRAVAGLPRVSFEETVPGRVFTRGMARRILDFRPDVAIVGGHAIPGLHRAMAVLSRHGVPWLFWEEFHPLPERPVRWRTAVRKRLLFSALERCTAVLGIGQRAVAYFTALTGEAKPIHNFPYGSDLARFTREAMVIPEAMAAGLPIIATRQTGAAIDCVPEGETGFLFDRDDADALVRHMEYFCKQPQAARRVGERAREACRMLDAPQAARRLNDIVSAYARRSGGEEGRPRECLRMA